MLTYIAKKCIISLEISRSDGMRFLRLFIALVLIFSIGVCPATFAEGSSEILVHFSTTDIPTMIEGGVVLGIQDANGNLIDTKVGDVRKTNLNFDIYFNVPEYKAGDTFYIVLGSGAKGLCYNGVTQDRHLVDIKTDENGKLINEFSVEIEPAWNKEAVIYFCMETCVKYETRIVNDEVFVTYDLLDALGIKHTFTDGEKPTLNLKSQLYSYSAQLFMNDANAYFGNELKTLSTAPYLENGKPFIPLKEVAIYFACDYKLKSLSQYMDEVYLSPSAYTEIGKNIHYVNSRDLTSKTDYLIWISKGNYKVYVYKGTNRNWRFVKALDCAIGAPNTPTIEGVFEYFKWQPKWTYEKFYCGPIMRFYNGYALHSTLIKYNGTPYDNRVGVKISHGCVRIRPEGIKWLSGYIPIGTTVAVTAQ